jgi:predicted O-linked N-acetylglucosamine transferase (SPINDLY family)
MLTGNMGEALPFFRKALALDPTYGLAAELLATGLWNEGDIPGVRAALAQRAEAALDPVEQLAVRFKAATVHPPLATNEAQIDDLRAHYESFLRAGPGAAVPNPWKLGLGLNIFADYHARPDRALREAAASYFLKATPSLGENLASARPANQKIRVGLASHYFYNHTVAYLTAGLIRGLDRRRFDVVVFRTPHGRRDAATDALAKDATLITLPADLAAARRAIADADLDILHYPELGSDPYTYFLAFARLAPLQTATWGHPVTTGLSSLDLYLSQSDMEPADADDHYTERLVRLKELSINVRRPATPDLLAREEFGMAADRPAYVCAQNLFKLHHAFDDTLRLILDLDRDGLLYFVSHSPQVDGLFARRLRSRLGAHFARVRFLPRTTADGFLALLRQADVLLDVPQWAGGKTSLESFAVGTPLVHQPGAFMRGRHTLAFLRKMDLADTLANDAASYAEIAVRLVQDGEFRRTVRGEISERSVRLFEDTASIREIENVWRAALKERV